VDGLRVSSRNPAVRLDFGGFAKGYSVGEAVQMLASDGIENLIINAGGDLCVRGKHGRRPWRIGIRHPTTAGVLASIELEGSACVFTSGGYERFFEYNGERFHHILDPRTGYPAPQVSSVTVLAQDPALADAAATALFVAGPGEWQNVALAMGIDDVLLVDEAGNAYITPELAEGLQFEQAPASVEIVTLQRSEAGDAQ
jgi:thiamine biosynthesis lipoprotein